MDRTFKVLTKKIKLMIENHDMLYTLYSIIFCPLTRESFGPKLIFHFKMRKKWDSNLWSFVTLDIMWIKPIIKLMVKTHNVSYTL